MFGPKSSSIINACGRLWAAVFAVQDVARCWRDIGSVHTRLDDHAGRDDVWIHDPDSPSIRTRVGSRGSQRLFSLNPDAEVRHPLCGGRPSDPSTVRARTARDDYFIPSIPRHDAYAAFNCAPRVLRRWSHSATAESARAAPPPRCRCAAPVPACRIAAKPLREGLSVAAHPFHAS